MWPDKVRYGLQDLDLQLCQIAYAKSRVVDTAHARFRKNDCRVLSAKFRVQDSTAVLRLY
eukprot:COSAG05_NODE_166_length_15185_cov_10.343497_7_plen_60_part_00